jgi:hypothetical protein
VKVRHGAGAVVSSKFLSETTEDQMHGQLGTALTHLALAGLSLSEVKTLVEVELARLFKEKT